MAKAQRNVIIRGISGTIGGNLVFRQMPDGSTYISAKPDFSRRVFSRKQKEHQKQFQEAVAYARQAAKTQPIYAKLADGTILSPYNIALSDWFNPPVIHKIERLAGRVRIHASDNVMVTHVHVTILNETGEMLEEGEAAQVEENIWEFATTNEGKILAEAHDLAGNVTRAESKSG